MVYKIVKINTDQGKVEENDKSKGKEETGKNSLLEWRKLKPRIRQLWIDRYLAEKQLNNITEGENLDDFMPINDYADFLFQALRVKENITEEKLDEVFYEFIDALALDEYRPKAKKVHKEPEDQKSITIPTSDETKPLDSSSTPVAKKKSSRTRLESIFS